MTTTEHTTVAERVHAALRYLASQCDGAKDKDGVGFSAIDAQFGHALAASSSLSPAQVVVGAKMLRKYRRQLENGHVVIPGADEVAASVATPPPVAASPASNPRKIYLRKDRVCVEYPFDPRIKAVLDPFKKGPEKIQDWEWNLFGRNEWSYPAAAVDKVLDALQPFARQFDIAPEIAAQRDLQREQAELEARQRQQEIDVAMAAVEPYLDGEPLPGGRVLFAHQREAVKRLIEGQRMILSHDMGLGKTTTALIAAKAYGCTVIVVAPVSVHGAWFREAEQVGVAIEVWSWAKMPEPPECNYVLIADEAHYAQSGEKTVRGAAFLALADNARAVFALTGTPLKNGRPINLLPLLQACKNPVAADRRQYEDRYCAAHQHHVPGVKRPIWDVTGAAHLDELYRKTSGVTILYKKKKDCLDLPEKTRIFREVEVSPAVRKEYLATLERLREESKARIDATKALNDVMIALAREAGQEIDEDDLQDPENARALVELGILRHAGSLAKVEAAIEIAQEILEQGESIVIFTAYLETLKRIAEAFTGNVETIVGGQSAQQRQDAIDRFQAKESRVIVCMLQAGGVGITLTAAQTVLLVDRLWTPGDAVQAEDRIHRIGQTGNCTAIWLQYEEVDAKIDAILQAKQERIELVLSGKAKSLRGIKSIQAMAKSILAAIKKHKALEIEESDEIIEAPMVEEIAQPAMVDALPGPVAAPKPKHAGGRPRKDRVLVAVKLSQELKERTADLDRSQLIIDLLNKHFGIEEE